MVGEGNPDELLGRYRDSLEVAPHIVWMEETEVEALAAQVGVDSADLEALVDHVESRTGCPGVLEGRRLGFRTTANPDAKYEWLRRGGRFDGYLKLRAPRPAGWLRRLRGLGPVTGVSAARKSEVDVDRILDDPPFALVLEGVWHDAGWDDDSSWPERFRDLFEEVSDDAFLQVVDAHC